MATGRLTRVRTRAGVISAAGSGGGSGSASLVPTFLLAASGSGSGGGSATITGPSVDIEPLWDLSVRSSSTDVVKVEVWDGKDLKAILRPTSGSVTEDFVTGVRATLQATFDPTAAEFLVPGVELRPFRGFDYGTGLPEWEPLGCFPLNGSVVGIKPDADIPVSCQDRWQWIAQTTFLTGFTAVAGRRIKDILTELVVGTGMWKTVTNTITSDAVAATQVWDSDRNQAIADLCKAVGAEGFPARDGSIVLQDRQAVSAPAAVIGGGDGGRLIDGSVSVDTTDVFNVVIVIPQNDDPAFALQPVTVKITDPTHPAVPIFGKRAQHPFRLDQGQATSQTQMKAMAQKVLTKISAPARQVTLQCLVDVRLKASNTFTLRWPNSTTENLQIQQIVHPLTVGDVQQIVGVSTRSDEDFEP